MLWLALMGACVIADKQPGAIDGATIDGAAIDATAIDATAIDAVLTDAAPACGGLTARATTRGLWCFNEGTGTTSANLFGSAPSATGIVPSEWQTGGGVRPTTSTITAADHTSLDQNTGWTIEIALTVDGYPSPSNALFERAIYPAGDRWVFLALGASGQVTCEIGTNGGDAYSRRTPDNALSLSVPHVVTCRRATSGTISILIDGASADTLSSGGAPHTTPHAMTEPLHFAHTTCGAPCNAQPLNGVLRGVAFHAD